MINATSSDFTEATPQDKPMNARLLKLSMLGNNNAKLMSHNNVHTLVTLRNFHFMPGRWLNMMSSTLNLGMAYPPQQVSRNCAAAAGVPKSA